MFINETFGVCRFVYNYFLEKTKEKWENGRERYTYFDWYKDITPLKNEFPWLRTADSHAVINSIKDLDIAYQRFFREDKNGNKHSYPVRKKKKCGRQSYRTDSNAHVIRIAGNKIFLPVLKWVYCRNSYHGYSSFGKIVNATVTRLGSGKYYVTIYCENVEERPFEKTNQAVGIDVGLKNLATLSDGKIIAAFQKPPDFDKKLAQLQKRNSRKQPWSNNWIKARRKISKHYERMTNQRHDYYEKVTTQIVKDYDIICIEDLSIHEMVQNSHTKSLVNDAALWGFRRMIENKARMHGKIAVIVDRFFPSSQICSECGSRWGGTKNLAVREWTCPECGSHHDRDINAAKNLLMEGLRSIS